ncbi:hypothetical protein F5X68DRAFT_171403 [Plectosphaerella plurivora]|uniref:AAA+ ATPase domain-containing protein n=1 Tax=Plectosphaerella plurivora TaxID=936078 RepID=A0A9P8V8E2_9PEZI|nr:hypothetical protein F5X68DRAFT_171403 [Plectosphaerella plurivora]
MFSKADTGPAVTVIDSIHEPVTVSMAREEAQRMEFAPHHADSTPSDHGNHLAPTETHKDVTTPGGGVSANSATNTLGDATRAKISAKKDNGTSKGWFSPAKLFCPVSGRSHAALIDFNHYYCPLCGDNFTAPKNLDVSSRPGTPKTQCTAEPGAQVSSDDPKSDHDKGDVELYEDDSDSEDESNSAEEVSYLVECWSRNNKQLVGREPIEEEFDLALARHGIDYEKSLAFEVITVLWTTSDRGPQGVIAPPGLPPPPPPPSHMGSHGFPIPPPPPPATGLSRRKGTHQTVYRFILKDPSVKVWVHSTRIVIRSAALIRLLRRFVRFYPSENLDGSVLQLEEPFALIAHHHEELEQHLTESHSPDVSGNWSKGGGRNDATSDISGRRHLRALLDYFNTRLSWIDEEKSRYSRKMCSFRMLWLLYKPGDTVYIEFHGQLSAFVVNDVDTDPAILTAVAPNTPDPYVISVWNLTFDGRHVGRALRKVTIAPFEGERKILSLRIIPGTFFDQEDGGKVRQRLQEQGKWWYELLPGRQIYYTGPILETSKKKQSKTMASSQVQETLRGRVYVDPASFYQQSRDPDDSDYESDDSDSDDDFQRPQKLGRTSFNPMNRHHGERLAMCQCEECRGLRAHPPDEDPWKNYDILDPTVEKDLTLPGAREGPLHRYLLCDRVLPGFDLKSRTWAQLDVSYCMPFATNVRAIDNLVMPSERKDMIKALIQRFTSSEGVKEPERSWAADFIENKGEGQIFLLHGGPGVGKTYVTKLIIAECIAEYTGRPLLSLTCADIGTSELKMEQQLSKWFKLAEKWGAVMLIDEADVYLEQRLVNDLQRNSLVSVFLRCIEYYRGVLFLTTNRVGHFDDAFITRIHVIIRYDDLNRESCNKIWTQFFNKLDDEREDFRTTQRAKDYVLEDEEVGLMKFNGREIRNAFQTAVALAEFRFAQNRDSSTHKQPTLDRKDFEQVCKMMQQFKKYMNNLHGADQEDRAYIARSRANRLAEHDD